MKEKHKLNRESLPDALARLIRERILDGDLAAGEPLNQERLANDYNCSRIPVREALRQLETTGLVVTIAHRGTSVASLPRDDIDELFEMRAMVETNLLRHAIPRMGPEDLARADGFLAELDAAYAARDVSRWGSLNWAFHKCLYQPSCRAISIGIAESLNLQIERFIRLQLLMDQDFEHASSEHHELLALCERRDVEAATAFLAEHILTTRRALKRNLGGGTRTVKEPETPGWT
jgi:DNA-binding GntR family transcriptional regulator